VTFADGPAYDTTSAGRVELEAALPGARIELVPYGRKPPGGTRRNVLRSASDTFGHYATPTMTTALAQLAREREDVLFHLDDPGVALAALDLDAARLAYAPHNVEQRILRDIAARLPVTHRPFMELEWRKVAREEARIWRRADLCVAVSEVDAAEFRRGGARGVEIAPNGSDQHTALPLQTLEHGAPLRLLFVGSIRYLPYAHALEWFVRSALPAVRRAAGQVSVDVVGEHPDDVARADGVVYHGRVPDVLPFYEQAHALVLPVFEGSGTRLKVVEAAQLGRPIISTALGVEGLPLTEADYLRAEDVEGFAHCVQQLRTELETSAPAVAGRCASARRAVAELTWPQIADRLADAYQRQMTSVR
jgi:glycosyltransferase involved in cell wall biosynthesis